jgi:hypothetical protein
MTKEDLIRMARDAGFLCDEDWITYGLSQFEHFAALVAAAKQEEIESTLMRLHEQAADRHNYFQHAIKVLRGEA